MEDLVEGLKALKMNDSLGHGHHEEFSKIVDAVTALGRLDWRQMTSREKEMVLGKMKKYWDCFFEFRETGDVEKLREGRSHLEDAAGTWE